MHHGEAIVNNTDSILPILEEVMDSVDGCSDDRTRRPTPEVRMP